jgi:replicative DNA helicase
MAAPGAGKTTLCQQIAEEMAKRKKSVVFLNLEMSREQMLAKAISAKMAQEGKGTMSATDVLQGYRWTQEQRETVRKTLEEYRRDIYPYMKYNPAGMTGDLDQLTEYLEKKGQEAKEAGQQAPAVVLDYLHLVSTSKGLDLQELIKQTVAEIKHYCIKYDSIGIIISATNRLSNTTGRITLDSGRDSSNIEYGGDALISLNMWEVDQGKVKPNEPDKIAELLSQPCRHMILRVLKARLYQPGKEARIYFHAATNRFFGEYEFIPAGITGDLIPFEEPAEQEKEGPAAGTSKRRTL